MPYIARPDQEPNHRARRFAAAPEREITATVYDVTVPPSADPAVTRAAVENSFKAHAIEARFVPTSPHAKRYTIEATGSKRTSIPGIVENAGLTIRQRAPTL